METIFSMNVFNWNAQDGQHVISGYFWIFLGVAGGLTVFTFLMWLLLTSQKTSRKVSDMFHSKAV